MADASMTTIKRHFVELAIEHPELRPVPVLAPFYDFSGLEAKFDTSTPLPKSLRQPAKQLPG